MAQVVEFGFWSEVGCVFFWMVWLVVWCVGLCTVLGQMERTDCDVNDDATVVHLAVRPESVLATAANLRST